LQNSRKEAQKAQKHWFNASFLRFLCILAANSGVLQLALEIRNKNQKLKDKGSKRGLSGQAQLFSTVSTS
jgi:hypothetical protein